MNTSGNTRTTGKEQFYTPPDVAGSVVDRLLSLRPDLKTKKWLEPSGGTGSFIEALLARGVEDIVSYDIEPHHSLVKQGDFHEVELDFRGAVSVGNPPFGRNNALSIPFFNKCATHSDVVCFIVPKSWGKWSVTNRLDRDFHLLDEYDLKVDYEGSSSPKGVLNTVVQTWERRPTHRAKVTVQDLGMVIKTTPEDADVSLTVFGYSCGKVKTQFPRVPNTTQMFLKLGHDRALEALQSVDFSRFSKNVAYTEALSSQEINYLLNEYILGDPHVVLK
jgi:hypothetical protein